MKKLIFLLFTGITGPIFAQHWKVTVKAGAYDRQHTMVSVAIPGGVNGQMEWSLAVPGEEGSIAVQEIDKRLYWQIPGHLPKNTQQHYMLTGRATHGVRRIATGMSVIESDTALLITDHERPLLQYYTAVAQPPAGSDTVYRKSGFIHPLWAPNGAILTNIFPNAGHRHHMGIWNPWTHTMFEGKETDFWNVQKREGKVMYGGLLSTYHGPVMAGFTVEQQHWAYPKPGEVKLAIREQLAIRAYTATDNNSKQIWDMESVLQPMTDSGITLLQYRYGGGFGLRTTPYFTDKTSKVLTSEGKTRKDADSTRARWVMVTGKTPEGMAGLLIMNNPGNFDSPEPLRVWPENAEGGELMLNYSPTKIKEWRLINGNVYTLKYRIMVYSGELTVLAAEAAWVDYVHPPEVSIVKE
ncbi:PmoA family protein [Chitinophaga sp. Cy-1792]|uniref:DUF6807 domain-containing protein n=1 Tax=Chitinophaga sp. Cy-1792 TaxID=2608339 RepID=UPI00141E1C12|nr:PmoA family protein [Chitinophaga sp. Cy-1792]NIG53721.1 hypothetical protein [Chitinophaga sp. Cy-1792]